MIEGAEKKEPLTFDKLEQLSRGDQIRAIVQMVRNVLPSAIIEQEQARIRDDLNRIEETLPINPDKYVFEGVKTGGSRCWLYHIKSREPGHLSYALKVYKKYSRDNMRNDIITYAKEVKREFEQVKSFYGEELKDVFLPQYMLMLHDAENNMTLAILQPYEASDLKDIFLDFSQEQLMELSKKQPQLGMKLNQFITKTFQYLKEHGTVLDLEADKNVVLASNDGKDYRLLVLDPLDMELAADNFRGSAKTPQRLNCLRQIQEALNRGGDMLAS
ncbi:MAG: hypothetical protein AB1352_00725 [Patescibacteria group bacterium]